MAIEPVEIREFQGLNNRADPMGLGPQFLDVADDLDVDDEGLLIRRPGITTTGVTGIIHAFAPRSGAQAYLIDSSNALSSFDGAQITVLVADVGRGPHHFCELGVNVYLLGAEKAYEIRPDGIEEWYVPTPNPPSLAVALGSMPAGTYQIATAYIRASDGFQSGAPQAARITLTEPGGILVTDLVQRPGYEIGLYLSPPQGKRLYLAARTAQTGAVLNVNVERLSFALDTQFLMPPILGAGPIAGWDGRVWIALYDALQRVSRLYPSDARWRGHFIYDPESPIDVEGRVTAMADGPGGMVIGTNTAIYTLGIGEEGGYQLSQVYEYGSPGGVAWDASTQPYLWTVRGVLRGVPPEPISEYRLSVAPGVRAAGLVREYNGFQSYLVSPDASGIAFNPIATRVAPTVHAQGVTFITV